eukprot:6186550-Pleurochrysis_carterae.AAC.5
MVLGDYHTILINDWLQLALGRVPDIDKLSGVCSVLSKAILRLAGSVWIDFAWQAKHILSVTAYTL